MLELDKIYCMDCLEGMKQIEDKSIDLILTDPPYGLGFNYGKTYSDTEENLIQLIKQFIPETRRISKIVAVMSGITPSFLYPRPDWILACSWDTTGSYGYFGYTQWFPVLVYGKDLKGIGKINGILKSDLIVGDTGGGDVGFLRKKIENCHPCTKPYNLIEKLVKRLSNENQIILDPFIGCGTIAVACKKNNRHFIGFEISPEYCKIAERRLKNIPERLETFIVEMK